MRYLPTSPALIVLLMASSALVGCSPTDTAHLAPDSPYDAASGSYTLAPDARVTEGRAPAPVNFSHAYTLPELIDLAQRTNPATRAAWLRAREAAEAVGLAEAAYLPQLNAQVLGGAQASQTAGAVDPFGILPPGTVDSNTAQAAATLSLQWLLLDFGGRDAAKAEAGELSFAANAGFNGVHQKLINDVTQAYYALQAATRRQSVQARRLASANKVADAARARRDQGLATVADVAQAEQVVAQSRFDLTRATSESRTAATRLSVAMGVPSSQRPVPAFPSPVRLPAHVPASLDRFLTEALQSRPDLQAAFARARASEAHVAAVEAQFRPKIVASAHFGQVMSAATANDNRTPNQLQLGDNRPVASVFVGITIPLWDGGAKESRLAAARAHAGAAQADAENLRLMAEGEIIDAYEVLKSSLAANSAAAQLIETTKTTFGAAQSRFDQGLATVADVSTAQRLLYDAQLSQIEAQHAALSAAATLAFASGQIISAQ